ncbi:LCP family protein [Cellulomonas sp. S1-8]|uniref:LCP family protein n=1 Tax=Cellulomonas sp. S1-8 TaxID=2904790 RepID=UPI0022449C77|nr:LCP family protein [Cellulomonas sp. S1-8]UZN01945.1 LCP family protein [Cellulomonas sp. S1-8]
MPRSGEPDTGTPGAGTPGGWRPRRARIAGIVAVLVLVALVAWPVGLLIWANGLLQHTPALSGAAGTDGTTYLLAGSDARGEEGGIAEDGTEGHRTDTILLLHVPASGPTALVSLPRDTYVDVPGHGGSKLNSAFAWGGAPLLVQTVEGLTGLTVDHYAEIGMGGVAHLVDAVGGVNLCYDGDVDDPDSGMVWTAGCHDVDGTAALAFARMRKADLLGDVGRAQRQRQLIGAVMGKVSPRSLVLNPGAQVALVGAGTGALTFDEDAGVLDVARLAMAFRDANGEGGITGTPPIASMDHRPGDIGSTVLLDPDLAPGFFTSIRDGSLPPGPVGGVPGA